MAASCIAWGLLSLLLLRLCIFSGGDLKMSGFPVGFRLKPKKGQPEKQTATTPELGTG